MENFFNSTDIFKNGFILFLVSTAFDVVACVVAAKLIHNFFAKTKEKMISQKEKDFTSFISKLLIVITWALGIYSIASGIKPLAELGKVILGATSVISAIAGLAAKQTLENFFAGASLTLTQPFSTGDVIILPSRNIEGFVQEIDFRHTVIRTYRNQKVLVPNSILNSEIVQIKTPMNDCYFTRCSLTVAFDSDIDKVFSIITEALLSDPDFVDSRTDEAKEKGIPAVSVRLTEFTDYGLRIGYRLASHTPNRPVARMGAVNAKIQKEFMKNGIRMTIPISVVGQENRA